jgi:midasin (ATPase involved in ribosome maturation)
MRVSVEAVVSTVWPEPNDEGTPGPSEGSSVDGATSTSPDDGVDFGHDVPSCWRDVSDVFQAGVDRVLLYGPPGTGKTFAALRWGLRGECAERLTCTEESTAADVTGTWMPVGEGRWEFLEGPAIRAWRADGGRGGRLVLDEIDRAGETSSVCSSR